MVVRLDGWLVGCTIDGRRWLWLVAGRQGTAAAVYTRRRNWYRLGGVSQQYSSSRLELGA